MIKIGNKKISVILPVYNGVKYLNQAISSVLNQSFTDFEFIIINDGSTDESLKIIQSFKDQRIVLINRENKGLIATLNEGVSLSKAKYIARIDADDIWSDQNKLSKQIDYISNHQDCVVLGTWAKVINQDGQQISDLKYPDKDKEIRSKILTKNCFIHPSVIFSKEAYLKADGFDNQEKYVEDYGLWLRMGKFGAFANIPEYLMSYRIHGENITNKNNLIQSKNSLAVVKKYKSLYPNYFRGWFKWNLKIILIRLGVRT